MTQEFEGAVEPQQNIAEPIEKILDDTSHQTSDDSFNYDQSNEIDHEQRAYEKTMIPLSVAQKLREKKKELELELQWERQRNAQLQQSATNVEEDNSRFESATKEDLKNSYASVVRDVEERLWIKNNREKYEKVQEFLPQFLKQRPNLAAAINHASNRYEEAYELMDKLSSKQQQQLSQAVRSTPPKKETPNSPGSVPKAAMLNEAIDLMSMSDAEFTAWRANKRKRR